jgi:phosphoglycolate phosphatase-like HAD superfamily hydrolase
MFDTTDANTAYYNRLLEHFGQPPLTPEQFAYCHMHTVDNALAYLFADTGRLEEARAYRRRHLSYRDFVPLMALEPHLKPLLQHLRPQFKTAVGTNRSDTMEDVLPPPRPPPPLPPPVPARAVPAPKPAPDILNRILDEFALEAAEAIYIGDSTLDEQAAAAAGIPLVAYRNPALRAWRHIDSLAAVRDLLENGKPA